MRLSSPYKAVLAPLFLVAFLVAAPCVSAADTLAMHADLRVSGLCADLTCDPVPSEGTYHLLLRYPECDSFALAATTPYPTIHYCLPRHLCGDSLRLLLLFRSTDNTLLALSDTLAGFFLDNSPTQPPTPMAATADSLSGRLVVSWTPSPDPDIMGYYLCTGNPCLNYDTVWGRDATSYLCADHLATESHTYRLLAFDSCFHASPFTDYFGNIVLDESHDDCSRTLHYSWRLPQMPHGFDWHYQLVVAPVGGDSLMVPVADNSSFDFEVPYGSDSVVATLVAFTADDVVAARSNMAVTTLDRLDTAAFLLISTATYDASLAAVRLAATVDPSFDAGHYLLQRTADSTSWLTIDSLPYNLSGLLAYTDADVEGHGSYRYRLAAPDACRAIYTYSPPFSVTIPSMTNKGVFFPSIFTPARITNNRFCPYPLFVGPQHYHLYIYNRSGALVFESEDPTQCWDGTHDGYALPQGVYVYLLRLRYADGTLDLVRGTVMLVE